MKFNFMNAFKKAAVTMGVIAAAAIARPYIVGVDVSWVLEDESLGAKYYHDGKQQDLFDILQDHGINFIRVRTFVNSCVGYATESYSGANSKVCWCDLDHTIALAKRIKAHNMGFFLDFHMSDTWASIGKQYVPASWKGKSNAEMGKLAYDHVKTTMNALMKEGLRPDMVQVGNEINSAVSGVSISKTAEFANIINSGVKAVRDIDPSIKIVMQHGRPRPDGGFESWYNKIDANIDYDAICGSTYGTTNNGQDWRDMFGLVTKKKKPVLSCEYTADRTKLINGIMNDFGDLGWGTFVWEPTRYSNKPMFDRDGQKYTANARLDELAAIAKQYNATLPDWVGAKAVKKLAVKTAAAAGGTIAQSIEGSEIAEGSKVTFTAVPLEGWEFTGWTGDNSGTAKDYTVASLNKEVNLGANFKFVGKDSLNYEAENSVFNKTVLESTHVGFSGKGYANLDNAVGSSITIPVCMSKEGDQKVRITYANGSTKDRPVSISVNGVEQIKSESFGSTGEWTDWTTKDITLKLPAGVSNITFTSTTADGGPNMDKIQFVVASIPEVVVPADQENKDPEVKEPAEQDSTAKDPGTTPADSENKNPEVDTPETPADSNSSTAIAARRIEQARSALRLRNDGRIFFVNGRSANSLQRRASRIKVYSK
ncbi:MAG: glycosyl hydrolase 53 family protein [Fibrobacter sp.]|nr:glycosyl hydrolase 53 family protein [Fibrobacter sp.]